MEKPRNSVVYTVLGYIAILGILVVIAIVFGSGVVFIGRFFSEKGIAISERSVIGWSKWGGLVVDSILLFGWAIKHYKRLWRNRVFWNALTLLLAVHLAVFWFMLRAVQNWQMIWFLLTWPVELALIVTVIDWSMAQFQTRHHQRRPRPRVP